MLDRIISYYIGLSIGAFISLSYAKPEIVVFNLVWMFLLGSLVIIIMDKNETSLRY